MGQKFFDFKATRKIFSVYNYDSPFVVLSYNKYCGQKRATVFVDCLRVMISAGVSVKSPENYCVVKHAKTFQTINLAILKCY